MLGNRIDIPEYRRCCFCIPLRYGLLVWSYIKLVCVSFIVFVVMLPEMISRPAHIPAVVIALVVFLILDIIMTTIMLVAAHMKHPKALRVYYYYCLVVLASMTIILLVCLGITIYDFFSIGSSFMFGAFFWFFMIQNLFVQILVIVVHVYITLLVRSEVDKLTNTSTYQFENLKANAAGNVEAAEGDLGGSSVPKEDDSQEHLVY